MGGKGKEKVGEGGTGLLDDVGVPGGDGVFVNRVSAEYRAKYDGRERELLVRVVKQEMVHMEFVSSAITGSSGDATVDSQFGHDCYLSDEEWRCFCREFFRDPTITKDEVGARRAVRGLFLRLHGWFDGGRLGTMDCPNARLNYLCQDLVLWLLLMVGSCIDYEDLLVRGWGKEGFVKAFGSGVSVDKIARRLVSFSIAARNLFRLWVETEMFRGGGDGDRLRGFVGPIRTMMCSIMKGEEGEAGYEFEDENVDVGEDRLRILGAPTSDAMVGWVKNFLVRDKGQWEYLGLGSGLLTLFSIEVSLLMWSVGPYDTDADAKACPLGRYEGEREIRTIEWHVDGLDGFGKRSSWEFCANSGLTWARLNCDFSEGGGEADGQEDPGVDRR